MKIEMTIKAEDAHYTNGIVGWVHEIGKTYWQVRSIHWSDGEIPDTIKCEIELWPIDKCHFKPEMRTVNIFYLLELAIL